MSFPLLPLQLCWLPLNIIQFMHGNSQICILKWTILKDQICLADWKKKTKTQPGRRKMPPTERLLSCPCWTIELPKLEQIETRVQTEWSGYCRPIYTVSRPAKQCMIDAQTTRVERNWRTHDVRPKIGCLFLFLADCWIKKNKRKLRAKTATNKNCVTVFISSDSINWFSFSN